jgi:hypothetical protein
MAVNGIKMNGLKEASEETRGLHRYQSARVQIDYDTNTGDVITHYHGTSGDYVEYHDKAIIYAGMADGHMTQNEVALLVEEAVRQHNWEKSLVVD